ncbi:MULTISPECIES: rhomboid family intramembrane serine protease [unclassified Acinetobacter]|uniref:rhomboid family intramembrane serine protease n=1 Tax=unclassified Acinetobacter TaxID=196816 RepID=UPI0035B6BC80
MSTLLASHSILIIIITVAISLVAFSQRRVLDNLIFWGPAVQRGEYYRLFTYGFVHTDGFHLLFNMMTLFFFGRILEVFYRQFAFEMGFALFYLGGLFVSILPSYFKHKNNPQYLSLGASGAVSAVLFAYILFQPWKLIFVFFIPMPAIIFAVLYVGYSVWASKKNNDHINHDAHLWGAAYGIIMTIILEPNIVPYFFSQLLNPRF